MSDSNEPRKFPDEATIHAYVDGRLDSTDCARVEAWLTRHPDRAEEVRGWRRDAQQLRAALGELPAVADPGRLDPATLRARHRRRVRARLTLAASLLLALCVGGIGGWQARRFSAASASAPMADAIQAYRMFATNRHARLDVIQQHPGELQAWLDQHFSHATELPDLAASGFAPIGGRLIATDSGPAAMVVYEDNRGGAISFYIRSPSPHTGPLSRGHRRDGQLAAAYWSANGYNYALVGRADAHDLQAVRGAARAAHNRRG